MKDFSNRREGTNERKNASVDFRLIGIHRGIEQFGPNANLTVGFYAPKEASGSSLSIQALEVHDIFHYFMQSKNGVQWQNDAWKVFKPWPTKDVIDGLGIHAKDLAVLAAYNDSSHRVYLPVVVSTGDPKPKGSKYTFQVVNGPGVIAVDLMLTDAAGRPVKIHMPKLDCPRNEHPGCFYSQGTNTFSFDLDMSQVPEGQYRLKLTGKVPGAGSMSPLEVLFYHHP